MDPPEVKFTGYTLDKTYSATVRMVNRAPVPQRITILPPDIP